MSLCILQFKCGSSTAGAPNILFTCLFVTSENAGLRPQSEIAYVTPTARASLLRESTVTVSRFHGMADSLHERLPFIVHCFPNRTSLVGCCVSRDKATAISQGNRYQFQRPMML
jgi:hypothetical protein